MPRLVNLRKPDWQWRDCKTGIRASAWLTFDTCSPFGPMLIGSVCWRICAKHRCPKDKPKRLRQPKKRLSSCRSRAVGVPCLGRRASWFIAKGCADARSARVGPATSEAVMDSVCRSEAMVTSISIKKRAKVPASLRDEAADIGFFLN